MQKKTIDYYNNQSDDFAVDGSFRLFQLASEYTGIQVRKMDFQELNDEKKYDGIWACASILHLTSTELSRVLVNIARALMVVHLNMIFVIGLLSMKRLEKVQQ